MRRECCGKGGRWGRFMGLGEMGSVKTRLTRVLLGGLTGLCQGRGGLSFYSFRETVYDLGVV